MFNNSTVPFIGIIATQWSNDPCEFLQPITRTAKNLLDVFRKPLS